MSKKRGGLCPHCQKGTRPLARFCAKCGQDLGAWNWGCRGGTEALPGVDWTGFTDKQPLKEGPGYLLLVCGLGLLVGRDGSLALYSESSPEPLQHERIPVQQEIRAYPAVLGPFLLVAEGSTLWVVNLLDLVHAGRPRFDKIPLRGPVVSDVACDGAQHAVLVSCGGAGASVEAFQLAPGHEPARIWTRDLDLQEEDYPVRIVGSRVVVGVPGDRAIWLGLETSERLLESSLEPGTRVWPWSSRGDFLYVANTEGLYRIQPDGRCAASIRATPLAFAVGADSLLYSEGPTLRWVDFAGRGSLETFPREGIGCAPFVAGEQALAVTDEANLYIVDNQAGQLKTLARLGLDGLGTPRGVLALPRMALVSGDGACYRVGLE